MTLPRSFRCIGILLLVGTLLAATGCRCQPETIDDVVEDFQACTVPLCDWTAMGTAVLASTFHSAELGLRLSSGASVSKTFSLRAEEIQMVSNCPNGILLTLTDSSGRQLSPRPMAPTSEERDNPWYRLAVVVGSTGIDVSRMTIANTHAADCIIDQIRIADTVECD